MSNILWTDGDDPQLASAMCEARNAFPVMLAEIRAERERFRQTKEAETNQELVGDLVEVFLGRPKLGIETSMVKVFVPHPQKPGAGDHIWINDPQEEDPDSISGEITVPPTFQQTWEEGDRVTFPRERISDWVLVYGDGRTFGGYTFPILRARMSENQQAAFDEQWGNSFRGASQQRSVRQTPEIVTTGIPLDLAHYARYHPWIRKTKTVGWILGIIAVLSGCAVPLNRNDPQHLDQIMLVLSITCGLMAVAALALRRIAVRTATGGYESLSVVPGVVISEQPLQYVAIANLNSRNGRRVYAMKLSTLDSLPSHESKVGTRFPCTARFYFLGQDGCYEDFLTEPMAFGTNDSEVLQARLDSIDNTYIVALQKCIKANYLPQDENELKRAT